MVFFQNTAFATNFNADWILQILVSNRITLFMLFFQFTAFMTLVIVGRIFRTSVFDKYLRRKFEIGMALFSLGLIIAYQVISFFAGYDFSYDLPLQLCEIMAIVSSLSLLLKQKMILRMLVAPMFCGPLLSLLFPYGPKGFEFTKQLYFFSYHTLLILISLYVAWVMREKIKKQDYLNSLVFVLGAGILSTFYNPLTGGNYIFTAEPIIKTKLFVSNILIYYVCFFSFMACYMGIFLLFIKRTSTVSTHVKQFNTIQKRSRAQ